MRLLVISDLHGNLAALEAVVTEPHDAVVCLGDLVGYGPDPEACVRRVRASAGVVVQGNHDRALAQGVPPGCRQSFQWLAEATAGIGRSQLFSLELEWLAALPSWAYLDADGVRLLCVHATPSDPLYRYLGPEPDAWEREIAGAGADFVLVGHTHLQFDLLVSGARVVNPGSVGQPKDGDPRAAYAVIEDGRVILKRVAYDVERTVARYAEHGVSEAAVEALAALLRSGRPGS